jgi:3-phosphoshikimate 1-carboxyvinyltransferase
MRLVVEKSSLKGAIEIPGSKSHTIRAVSIASLAQGESEIYSPLVSSDTLACVESCRAFGAQIELGSTWQICGVGGEVKVPEDIINVANSGTTCRIAIGIASLAPGYTVFTGDEQTRKRPMQPLLEALNNLGAHTFSTRGNGCLPVVIKGRIKGGFTQVEGITSQYLTSLLISTPLAEDNTIIEVRNLHERPYVEMTMNWLDKQGILYRHKGLDYFEILGEQRYKSFKERIPGDFSSATFFLCAGAIANADVTLMGLDMNDSQGDKKVVQMLQAMGAKIAIREKEILVRGGELIGQELDLNDTPDALPALAVAGCCARGTTVLHNVPQARIKETDRIAVMRRELSKMGAKIEELPDGLIIHQSKLQGAKIEGYGDHRIVMSMAIAGLIAEGVTEVSTAEAIKVTFPNFVELLEQLGAKVTLSYD